MVTAGGNVGARVEDSEQMLGLGVVLQHDAVEALVRFDALPEPVWSRWADLELVAA